MKAEDHDRIIDIAFGPKSGSFRLSAMDLDTLKRASRDVDDLRTGQSRSGSFKHAMRGDGQARSEAEALAKTFMNYHLQLAADLQHGGSHDQAIYYLGMGMHTIADSYSPAHEGFRPWCGDTPSCIPSDAEHWDIEHSRDISDANSAAAMALRQYYQKFRKLSGLDR